ncbi:uncharacterized protein LOC102704713 [Oryza brachyantha]|uniref:uncharacterized protein LOC102704713 n=1 Tax=Oryza brachyantha TaxID=4533 RepID=UPI001ADC0E17|nr:uncharacterized protein LOC102704713 [Oryza brachyantha]
MDRHGSQGGGCDAVLESGGAAGQAGPVVDVDGAFLLQLLEDTPAAAATGQQQMGQEDDDADDRLSRVMRSLEAEIGGGAAGAAPAASVPVPGSCGDGHGHGAAGLPASSGGDGLELDDVLSVSDFDGSTSRGSTTLQPFEYWARAELPPAIGAHDMGGWCVDGDGLAVAAYEFREPCYYNYSYNESSHVDQPYSPLWEIGNE